MAKLTKMVEGQESGRFAAEIDLVNYQILELKRISYEMKPGTEEG